MEFTTSIETVDSPLPRNINELTALEIKKPCSVDRAYQLVEDYPNLAHLKIAGSVHTRQEIKQLPFGQMIGGAATMHVDIATAAIRPATDFETWAQQPPAPPAPALIPEPIPDIWTDEPVPVPVPVRYFFNDRTNPRVEPIFTWDEAAIPADFYTGDDGGVPPW